MPPTATSAVRIDPDRLYTPDELSELSGLSARRLVRMMDDGRIGFVLIGRERSRRIEGQQYLDWKASTGEDLAALSTHARETIDYWLHATVPTFEYVAPIGDQKKGLGLGLAIVKRLAGLMGAPLSLRSEMGKGSVFTVALPRRRRDPAG